MKADRPKQFLTLAGKTVLEHSLTLLLSTLPTDFNNPPAKVVLVMNEEYSGEFEHLVGGSGGRLIFADPGIERQGSVENGLNKVSENGDGEGGKACSRDETDPSPLLHLT
jgi:2-C-methyl-D-erythritol 4-phosphate cytidylyltransferase